MKTGNGPDSGSKVDRQQEIVAFLNRYPSWDGPGSQAEDIRICETHGAYVLIGKDHAVKIKKAVTFDYMDYGTLENRHHFCLREMELNRRTAPQLYLDVIAIYQSGREEITFTPDNNASDCHVIEWMLKMRCFDLDSRFDILAAQGRLSDKLLDDLTDIIADFHGALDGIIDLDMTALNRRTLSQNFDHLDDFVPVIFQPAEVAEFRRALSRQLDRHSKMITKRSRQGYVRFAHGDLHLQNICLIDERPSLFDGIEYCDDFAISDILYDLSFLLMDLKANLSVAAANRVLNRYFMQSGDPTHPQKFEALSLLPYFLSVRAGIRTHVYASQFLSRDQGSAERAGLKAAAKSYFEQAMDYLKPTPPRLIAIGGFSGSGKSTLAAAIAPLIGTTVGALHVRSDVIRRKIMNWDEFSPMPATAYTAHKSEQVYELMRQIAVIALKADQSVILDAVFDRREDRDQLATISEQSGVPFDGIWLEAAIQNMADRISGRTQDASDATVEVLHAQLSGFPNNEDGIEWHRLKADTPPQEVLTQALKVLAVTDQSTL